MIWMTWMQERVVEQRVLQAAFVVSGRQGKESLLAACELKYRWSRPQIVRLPGHAPCLKPPRWRVSVAVLARRVRLPTVRLNTARPAAAWVRRAVCVRLPSVRPAAAWVRRPCASGWDTTPGPAEVCSTGHCD